MLPFAIKMFVLSIFELPFYTVFTGYKCMLYLIEICHEYPQKKHNYTAHIHEIFPQTHYDSHGAQWLSGRVLDSRPKGRGFEPHRRHCVVVLEQDTFILA